MSLVSTRVTIMGLAALLSGCSTLVPNRSPGPAMRTPEFVGRVLTVEAANNQVSTMRFWRDGTVRARFSGAETAGRWDLEGRNLCFTWGGNYRECWPHAEPFRLGRTRAITSDRGNRVRVTMN